MVGISCMDGCACVYPRHCTSSSSSTRGNKKKKRLYGVSLIGKRDVLCHGHGPSDGEQPVDMTVIDSKVLTPLPGGVQFCILCGCGDGTLVCPRCTGRGVVLTRPGGAGVAGAVGQARCKICSGLVRWWHWWCVSDLGALMVRFVCVGQGALHHVCWVGGLHVVICILGM